MLLYTCCMFPVKKDVHDSGNHFRGTLDFRGPGKERLKR